MREAVAAVFIRDGRILLGKRSAERRLYPNVWDVIGGHVEAGETHEQALGRELGEELGIAPIAWEFLATLAEDDVKQYGDARYHFYRVTDWNGTPENLDPREHSEIRWFTLEEALTLPLASPQYPQLFASVLRG